MEVVGSFRGSRWRNFHLFSWKLSPTSPTSMKVSMEVNIHPWELVEAPMEVDGKFPRESFLAAYGCCLVHPTLSHTYRSITAFRGLCLQACS